MNLGAAEGHPAAVMDMSFANQALSAEYVVAHHAELEPRVYVVPEEIDAEVARLKLAALGITLDDLTPEQKAYVSSGSTGPDEGMARRRALAILDVTVKAAALGLAIYPIVNPSASHFAGKAMGVRALIYPLALLAIPAWWYLVGRPQPYPFVADIAFAMPFLVDSAGNVLGSLPSPASTRCPMHSAGSA